MSTLKQKKNGLGFLFAVLAVLFQPFFKIALGRTIWNLVDIVIAVFLFVIIIKRFKKK